jgi:hypothetical protein
MMTTSSTRLVALMVAMACALATCAVGSSVAKPVSGVQSKAAAKHKKKKPRKARSRQAAAHPLAAVPEAQAALFGLLRRPAAPSVPNAVTRQALSDSPSLAPLKLDASQARGVTVGTSTFYLVPGADGLCLFLEDGIASCKSDMADAAKNGLDLAIVPAPKGPVKPGQSPVGAGTVTVYGVAPDDVTDVVGITQSGRTVSASRSGNGFVIRSSEQVRVTFLR